MSDNIDYTELDKAVNEAFKTRSRPVAPKKAVRSRGQYIDFATPRRPASIRSTSKKTASHPKSVASKPVVKRAMRPQAKTKVPTAVVRPLPTHRSAPAVAKPAVKASVPTKRPAPTPKPAVKVEPKVEEPKAPNANNYSLGGRSPFIIDTKVDKRPLGTNIPETSARTVRSTRNTYSQKEPAPTNTRKHKAKKHVVADSPKKHSGWLWALAVLLIICAGAGLGYLAYKLVFAN